MLRPTWTRVVVTVLVPMVLLGVCIPVADGSAPRPLAASSSTVAFIANLLPLSTVGIGLELDANVALSGGSISPNETVQADAAVTVPSTIEVAITYHGTTAKVPVPGLGTTYDLPVPGLSVSYLGFQLGVFLNFSGTVTGESTVGGPGAGGGGPLNWSSSATRSFTITADRSAAPGSAVVSQLDGLAYGVSMGLDAGATIPLVGHYVLHLLNFGTVGVIPGTPASLNASYTVPDPSGGASDALSGSSVGALGVVLVAGVAVIAGTILVVRRRRARTAGTPLAPYPPVPPTS